MDENDLNEHVAELSENTYHGRWEVGLERTTFDTVFYPWSLVWLGDMEERAAARPDLMFASVFKLAPSVQQYFRDNAVMQASGPYKGLKRGSLAGFRDAIPGLVGIDLDTNPRRTTLPAVIDDARRVLDRLGERGVPPSHYQFYFSGSKGFSLHLMASAFEPAMSGAHEVENLPLHESQVLIAIRAVCGDVEFDPGSRQTIRLFRLPNARHQRTNFYKVPLADEEVRTLSTTEVQDLARAPRWDVLRTPSPNQNDALAGMYKEALGASRPPFGKPPIATPRTHSSSPPLPSPIRGTIGPGTLAPPNPSAHDGTLAPPNREEQLLDNLPSELTPELLERARIKLAPLVGESLIENSEFSHNWYSVPVPGTDRDVTESGFDLHLARALISMDPDADPKEVMAAIYIRPGYRLDRVEGHMHYLNRTYHKAREYAERAREYRSSRSRSPVRSMSRPLESGVDLMQTWVMNSRIWSHRMLGSLCLRLYELHLTYVVSTLGKGVEYGRWSESYFLSINDAAKVIKTTTRTSRRHTEYLKCLGLLKLIKGGRSNQASTYRVRLPNNGEEEALIAGVVEMKKAFKEINKGWLPKHAEITEIRKRTRKAIDLELNRGVD